MYAAVLPELVPPSQPAVAGGFNNLMQLAGNLIGNGIGACLYVCVCVCVYVYVH